MRLIRFFSMIEIKYWKSFYFVLSIIISLVEANNKNDFAIYKSASIDLINNINPYSHSYIDGYYYYYSMMFGYIIYPFNWLPTYISNFLWLFTNFVLLYFVIIKLHQLLNISNLISEKQFLFYVILLAFNLRFIRENFHSGQVSILILFLMLYSFDLLLKGKYILSGFLLALAINIKLLALPLLMYYLYRGYFKSIAYTLFFLIVLYTLPLIWLNENFYFDCISKWWHLINPNNDHHLIDVEERSFHSITTLLTTLLMKNPPDIYALPIRRYILDLSPEYVKMIIQIVRIILISSVLFIIREFPFSKNQNIRKLFLEFSYILALIPLIFPHQQHYAFIFQMPALAFITYFLLTHSLSQSDIIFSILIFLCFNLKIILGEFNEYYEHFKILTYGTLMVIGFLQLNRTKLIAENNLSQNH